MSETAPDNRQSTFPEIARELKGSEYGRRDYAAYDTERRVWSFGDYRPAS